MRKSEVIAIAMGTSEGSSQVAAEDTTSTIAVMTQPVQPPLREDPALAGGGMPQLFADLATDDVKLPDSDISDEEELEEEGSLESQRTVSATAASAATLIVTKHSEASGLENCDLCTTWTQCYSK